MIWNSLIHTVWAYMTSWKGNIIFSDVIYYETTHCFHEIVRVLHWLFIVLHYERLSDLILDGRILKMLNCGLLL
jgi:hypothetical protein